MKKGYLFVAFCLFVLLLLVSCEKRNTNVFDKYASYTRIYSTASPEGSMMKGYENTFESIENCIRSDWDTAIIRVKAIDESDKLHKINFQLPWTTITKAQVLEIYFVGERLPCELNVGDYIWLSQGFYVDEEKKELVLSHFGSSLVVPGYEYLVYTGYAPEKIYNNLHIFVVPAELLIPLDISNDEYAKILERNNFNYIEHEDICTKAIEKYIHGKGTESEKQ